MFKEGHQIGLYKLICKLGRGGFGEVWLAERKSKFVTTKVALKLPLDEQINHEAIAQEASLWEQVSGHPNVLPIIDADEYDGQVVIVSEYAPDGSLADKIRAEGKFSIETAIETVIGILNGLEFLHSKRIIHRDIKPANILLQGDTPRLADFGISRVMKTTDYSSKIIGTDAYMSPESFEGKRNMQTDVWSVGVVLYQMLTGRLPFSQEHPAERMYAVLFHDFEPLPADIPKSLKFVIAKALAKKPHERYQSAKEMREDLQRILRSEERISFDKFDSQRTFPWSIVPALPKTERVNDQCFETGVETVVRKPVNIREEANRNLRGMALITDPTIAININQSFRNGMSAVDLYDYTRGIWRLSKERAESAKYAFAVYQGVIKEVYEIYGWHQAGATEYRIRRFNPEEFKTRFEFTGRVAGDAIRDKYLGKSLPEKHGQNPIRYYNC